MEFLIPPNFAQFSEHSSHDARVEFSKDSNESSKFSPWLSGHPRQWKTFVANRTSEIIEVLPTKHWRHVPLRKIPQILHPEVLILNAYLIASYGSKGPPWLRLETSSWPKAESSCDEAFDE
ncbi:hypothetical protein TNCV_2971911, partial [Trichonephila clavipes]